MAPSLPWAILWCWNLCIICRLAFYPCGSKKTTASSVLATPQCFKYNNTDKLTGSHNVAWLLRTPTVEFSLLFSLPVSTLQNGPISTCPSLCFCVVQHKAFLFVSLFSLFSTLSFSLSVPVWKKSLIDELKLSKIKSDFLYFFKSHCFIQLLKFVFVLHMRWPSSSLISRVIFQTAQIFQYYKIHCEKCHGYAQVKGIIF